MKLLTRKEFLELKENVLFSKYQPHVFGYLSIKDKRIENDFLYQQICDSVECESSEDFDNILNKAHINKSSFDIDLGCLSRDGCYDDKEMFAVWEKKDINKLINSLEKCL